MKRRGIVLFATVWILLSALAWTSGFFYFKKNDVQDFNDVPDFQDVQDLKDALQAPYREDIYGGATPQETWSMFVAALENAAQNPAGKEDIKLASRYFLVNKQKEYEEHFLEAQKDGELQNLINDYKSGISEKIYSGDLAFLNKPDSELKYFQYSGGQVSFTVNEFTKIWKIQTLQ